MMKIMANLTEAEQLIATSESQESDSTRIEQADSFSPWVDSGSPWKFSTIVALLLLFVLWAVKLYTTWGAWGNPINGPGFVMVKMRDFRYTQRLCLQC
jgi:hypothetical protein